MQADLRVWVSGMAGAPAGGGEYLYDGCHVDTRRTRAGGRNGIWAEAGVGGAFLQIRACIMVPSAPEDSAPNSDRLARFVLSP
jgi:hypothetical protein